MDRSTYLRFTRQNEWVNSRTEDLAGDYEEVFINTAHITNIKFHSEIVGHNRTVLRSAKISYRPGNSGFTKNYVTHKKGEIMMLKQFLGHRSESSNFYRNQQQLPRYASQMPQLSNQQQNERQMEQSPLEFAKPIKV